MPREEVPKMPEQRMPRELPQSATGEPSDHSLLWRFREGDQDAATRLYVRYAKRLNSLVREAMFGRVGALVGGGRHRAVRVRELFPAGPPGLL